VAPSAAVAASAELTGDVAVGEDTVIAAGARVTGHPRGAVRIGARVAVLENAVLRPVPGGDLVVEDDVVIGPAAVLQGCHVGSGTVVSAGALVDAGSRIGADSLVGTGAHVRRGSAFPAGSVVDGSPAEVVGTMSGLLRRPRWAPDAGAAGGG
jgi:carbonic anhydrase/acetyltransferase-like protein (isoleucine patch superfamily)